MKQPIRKALIPVAGRGTRFLPATKSVAKELFPIVDKPQVLIIAEEAVQAGVEEIVLITGPQKQSIEQFFTPDRELLDFLESKGQSELASHLKKITSMAEFKFVRQEYPKGLGHAVLTGREAIGAEPFYVLLGDEIMYHPHEPQLVLSDLARCYSETGLSSVTLMEVPKAHVDRYGIADVGDVSQGPQTIRQLIEKPPPEEAPSNWALPGRYLFSERLFEQLEDLPAGRNNEIQLTDAINRLCQAEGVYGVALNAECQRFDAGDKFGFVQANIEFALNHPAVSEKIKSYIKERALAL